MKKITKKEMLARVKDRYIMFNQRIIDTTWDRDSMMLTVTTISKYHTVSKHVWYYEPDDDSINYLRECSGVLSLYN